jgi:hypothetical protein
MLDMVVLKIERLCRLAMALIPTRLPQGMTEFEAWSTDIIDLYGMPDNDSVRFALAAAIPHLNATHAYVSKWYFGRLLLKGAANQIAYAKFQEFKLKQEAAFAAEKAKVVTATEPAAQ